MNSPNVSVAVFNTHREAEDAIKQLQRGGFDMKSLSIVGRDYHTEEHVVGYFTPRSRAVFGKYGALWGALAACCSALVSVRTRAGHIVVLGPLAAIVVGGAQGAVLGGGLTAIAGALSALGVPKDSVLRYETALKADKFLVVVHGDTEQQRRANEILGLADAIKVSSEAVQ